MRGTDRLVLRSADGLELRDYVFVGAPMVPVGWSSGACADLAPAGQVTAARIVCDRPLTGHMASDHYGVLAEVCWPGRPGSAAARDG